MEINIFLKRPQAEELFSELVGWKTVFRKGYAQNWWAEGFFCFSAAFGGSNPEGQGSEELQAANSGIAA